MKPKTLLPISKLTRKFLLKFFADPKKRFCVGWFAEGAARCAIGHLNRAVTGNAAKAPQGERLDAFKAAINQAFKIERASALVGINDGRREYAKLGKTPRARILAALRDAGRKEAGK